MVREGEDVCCVYVIMVECGQVESPNLGGETSLIHTIYQGAKPEEQLQTTQFQKCSPWAKLDEQLQTQ